MRKTICFNILSSIALALTVLITANRAINSINIATISQEAASLSLIAKTYIENEDELLLNNFLDKNKDIPGILKITVVENGRIIADTDAQDINTVLSALPTDNRTEFIFKGKKYSIILKTASETPPLLKALRTKILVYTFIYIIIVAAAYLWLLSFKESSQREENAQHKDQNEFKILTGSKTGIVLELSGENRIISASERAYSLFGKDIHGKNITEISGFHIIQEALSNGRTPLISDGKKYLLL